MKVISYMSVTHDSLTNGIHNNSNNFRDILSNSNDLCKSSSEINDRRVVKMDILVTPEQLVNELPVNRLQCELVHQTRVDIESVIDREDGKLVVVVGPCSIHDYQVGLEYARFLATMRKRYQDTLVIVMRTYFSKPRTTVGWKGYIYDPDLNGSCQFNHGLRNARKLLLEILSLGVPCSMEHLDTITPQYFGDLLSWAAIGARTTESQIHRELASGISSPIGFKNGTGGSIELAINAVKAAQQPHRFLGCNGRGEICSVETIGNPHCHLIMRGSNQGPNYESSHISSATGLLHKNNLLPNIFVDFSHGNSQKQHKRQLVVSECISQQIRHGNENLVGVMIESNLVEGNQSIDAKPLKYGQSITDACVNLSDTEVILEQLSKAVLARNRRK